MSLSPSLFTRFRCPLRLPPVRFLLANSIKLESLSTRLNRNLSGCTWGPTHWKIAIIMSADDCVQRWRRRASESPDPFDRFFSAWIALIVAARGHLDD